MTNKSFLIQLSGSDLETIIFDCVDRAIKENNSYAIATLSHPGTNEDKLFNVEQAADFLGISKQTIYQNIDKIPHSKRFGRLYFYPSSLRAYLDGGKGKAHE